MDSNKTVLTMQSKKTSVTLAALNKLRGTRHQDSFVINDRIDDLRIEECDFQHSIFEGIGVRNKRSNLRDDVAPDIVNCDFSHCVFRRCYFRYVRFRGCKFINCRFVDCDFPGSTFIVCDLWYAQFQNTNIEPGNILGNLPPHENLQAGLLRSARVNFSNRGEGEHARICFLKEMDASAEHFWKVAFSSHSFFREKYLFAARLSGFGKWFLNRLEHWFWGYGESPAKLFLWAFLVVLGFSLLYQDSTISYWEALRVSAFTFATVGYGDHLAGNTRGINWMLVESLIGVTFIGLLAASLFKWISRRQR